MNLETTTIRAQYRPDVATMQFRKDSSHPCTSDTTASLTRERHTPGRLFGTRSYQGVVPRGPQPTFQRYRQRES